MNTLTKLLFCSTVVSRLRGSVGIQTPSYLDNKGYLSLLICILDVQDPITGTFCWTVNNKKNTQKLLFPDAIQQT